MKWKHRGRYDALQIIRDTIIRDEQTGEDIGRHGINFHYGSETNPWSEGWPTLSKSSYWIFLRMVYPLMNKFKLQKVTYLLIEY